ncbi:MAG: DUF4124 domain-containing protein [Gammaproteobacteria bacterium]
MRTITLAAVLAATIAAAPAHAIYKWTDDQGNVQYSDSPPPPGRSGEKIKPPPPTDNAAAQKALKQRTERAFGDQGKGGSGPGREAAAGEAGAKKDEKKEDPAARKARCESARTAVDRLQNAQRIYKTDAAGNRVRQSAEEVAQQLTAARKSMQENCK